MEVEKTTSTVKNLFPEEVSGKMEEAVKKLHDNLAEEKIDKGVEIVIKCAAAFRNKCYQAFPEEFTPEMESSWMQYLSEQYEAYKEKFSMTPLNGFCILMLQAVAGEVIVAFNKKADEYNKCSQ